MNWYTTKCSNCNRDIYVEALVIAGHYYFSLDHVVEDECSYPMMSEQEKEFLYRDMVN